MTRYSFASVMTIFYADVQTTYVLRVYTHTYIRTYVRNNNGTVKSIHLEKKTATATA